MSYIRALSLLFLLCASCVLRQETLIPEPPPFSSLELKGVNSSKAKRVCGEFDGVYQLLPENFVVGTEVGSRTPNDEYAIYQLLPVNRKSNHDRVDVDSDDQDSGTLSILQPGPNLLEITIRLSRNSFGERYLFSAKKGDFQCQDGYLEFPIETHVGQLERGVDKRAIEDTLLHVQFGRVGCGA